MVTLSAHTLSSPSPPLRYQEIQDAACAVLAVLSRHFLEACLLGSTAGMLCGMEHRVPKDVDLLILNPLPDHTATAIKALVVSADPARFFLTNSRVPGATHQILWYSLSESASGQKPLYEFRTPTGPESLPKNNPLRYRKKSHGARSDTLSSGDTYLPLSPAVPSFPQQSTSRACKIDILIPGSLGIRVIPNALLQFHSELSFYSVHSKLYQPIAYPPLPFLLLLKLRAWQDHSSPDATEKMHGHIPQDEEDIEELLRLGRSLGMDFSMAAPKRDSGDKGNIDHWTLAGFSSSKEVRSYVGEYVRKWPRTANGWFLAGYL